MLVPRLYVHFSSSLTLLIGLAPYLSTTVSCLGCTTDWKNGMTPKNGSLAARFSAANNAGRESSEIVSCSFPITNNPPSSFCHTDQYLLFMHSHMTPFGTEIILYIITFLSKISTRIYLFKSCILALPLNTVVADSRTRQKGLVMWTERRGT